MSQKAAACAIALCRRGIPPKYSGNLCAFGLPLSNNDPLFSSAFHSSSHKDSPFSSKPRIDFSSINDVEDARCLFLDMVRMRTKPSVFQFTKLLTVVVKMKHYSVALSLFDKMCQLGAPVDAITMTIAINCYCLLSRVDFGFAILGTFFKRGCEPNVATFSTLIKVLFLVGEVAEVEKLFKKLLSEKLCEPDEIMFLTVLNGLSKAGHTLVARDLLGFFENMSCKPNVYAYSTVIDGLCKDRMSDDTLHLLSRMIEKGISPNVVTYNSIIQGLSNAGRWKDVKGLLNEMLDNKISPDLWTCNILVDAFCKEGMVEEAEKVLEIMMQRSMCPDVVTYSALMDGYCLRGQMGKAKRVLHSIVDSGLTPSIISYNSLINGYCKQGRVDEAWDLFLEVPCKGLLHDTVTYNTMIQGLFHKGRFTDGWKLINDMEARGITPNLLSYNILLDGLCKTHQIAEAFSFLQMMEGKGLVEDAKVLLIEMEKSGCAPDSVTYNVMIQGLLKRNELCNAMPLMEEMYKRGFLADAATVSLLLDQLQGKGKDKDDILLETIKIIVPKNEDLFVLPTYSSNRV
ncbi:UNVERIFIED_CONTAM: Pentatricopeptide repeat-containing protein, mitochondrial [Sesamum radiatum]|uniref:Pentatricopeptide repeat-containing protein, mitochondrial n=1 Tax=Sesamum radiatum TaxID=300843 RepID=A0AAW2UC85_SESRA